MKGSAHTARVIIGLFGMLAPHICMADGGLVQLHAAEGPFVVTIFLSADTAYGGPGEVSVLVQSQKTSEVVLDADVSLTFYAPHAFATNRRESLCGLSPGGAAFQPADGLQAVRSHATHEEASNKLLYAAAVRFDAPGIWRLRATVSRGPDRAIFDCPISIASISANPPGLWACLAFPPIVITVFALNQALRRRSQVQSIAKYEPESANAIHS